MGDQALCNIHAVSWYGKCVRDENKYVSRDRSYG